MEQKRRKIKKGKVENWKWKEERLQNEERTFFFCFVLFCFVFVFSLGFFFFFFPSSFFAFHFSKPLKFVLGLPKWKFSTGEKHFTLGKKSGKMTLPPLKNIPLMPLLYSSVPSKAVCSKIGTALWKIDSTDLWKCVKKMWVNF